MKKFFNLFNTNLIHNLLNLVTAGVAGVSAFLMATGCVALVSGEMECSQSFLSPELATQIIVGLMTVKMVINIIRDGITGLVKRQPPIE